MTVDDTMNDLFEQAEERGYWFFTSYQSLWFAPAELREHRAAGRFYWGPTNWTLRNPSELVTEKREAVTKALTEFENTVRRVSSFPGRS